VEGKGIGARLPRLEDQRYLRGRSQFVGDVAFPNMLHAAFSRSSHAHANILGIRKPGGSAGRVFVADDLAGVARIRSVANLPGYKGSDWPALAKGKVRHVGEPVAMALGRTPGEAEDLAAAIEVAYAPLKPVVTMAEAVAPDAPLVHEHWTDNILVEAKLDAGDFEAARAAAAHVVSHRFRMNRQVPLTLEGRGTAAHYDGRLDELVVWCSHQLPVPLQIGLSQTLGIAQRRLRVIAPDVGGSFGLKSFVESETVCVAWAAMTLRRPVRWIQDRHESLICDASCRDYICTVTGYADADGKVLALDCEVNVDAGAYSPWPWPAGLEGALALGNMQGPYDIRAFRGRGVNIVTNKPAAQPYRGVARPVSCIGHEMIMDALAWKLGKDPADIRVLNMVKPEQMPYVSITRKQIDCGDYPRALRRAMELADAPAIRARQKRGEPDGRLIGLGIASFYEQTAYGTGPFGYAAWGIELVPGLEPAVARLTGDGDLVLEVGSHSHGQGHETTYAQIAHEVLGIDPARVTLRHGDTSVSPVGTGTYSSRSAVTVGGAVDKACRALARPIVQIGAHLLQCREEDAAIKDGAVVGPSGSVGFAEIGRAWYHHPENLPDKVDPAGLTAVAGHKPHDPGVYGYSSHVAVVAIDPATGGIELLDYAIVTDCGRRINPLIVEGQVIGGFANGLGNALFEESAYDANGQPLATNFADYLMPSAAGIPELKLDFLEIPSPFAPYGIKGIGESAAIGPPSAIVSAINDALRPLGVVIYETPLTPVRIFQAIRAAGH
jgi:aerobic carbon-monoxide dehydrogenase large subunit